MAEALRARSQTVPIANDTKSGREPLKKLSDRELHGLLVRTVKDLGYDMSVFHLRSVP